MVFMIMRIIILYNYIYNYITDYKKHPTTCLRIESEGSPGSEYSHHLGLGRLTELHMGGCQNYGPFLGP